MREILLVATDLDGTLIGNNEGPEEFLAFRDLLRQLRASTSTRWAIVTGRHYDAAQQPLIQLLMRGLSPDYLVLEDARLYRRNSRGTFSQLWWWNFNVARRRRVVLRRYGAHLRHWRDRIRDDYPGAKELLHGRIDLWFRLPSVEDAEKVAGWLQDGARQHEDLLVFRWGDEVYAGPTAGSKGEALTKLATDLSIHPDWVFAVGDGPNDVSMLNGVAARLTACVGNAAPEVREVVKGAGGYLAKEPGLKGVVEALKAYLADRVPGA